MARPQVLAAAVVLSAVCSVAAILLLSSSATQPAELVDDNYKALLHREKRVLNSGGKGIDWGNQRFMANAEKEQMRYLKDTNSDAMKMGKQAEADAAKLYAKWSNPWKGTKYAKYDTRSQDMYDEAKARTTQLWERSKAAERKKLQRKAKVQLLKAHKACKGEAGCEAVLTQVMGMFGK